jgi:hypothetical protein
MTWQESDMDLALARSLQDKFNSEKVVLIKDVTSEQACRGSGPGLRAAGIVDRHWELSDPNPDIHQLFVSYDTMFFWGKLARSGVAVDWSKRMTL